MNSGQAAVLAVLSEQIAGQPQNILIPVEVLTSAFLQLLFVLRDGWHQELVAIPWPDVATSLSNAM